MPEKPSSIRGPAVILIPALNPVPQLAGMAGRLAKAADVVIVDDGSGPRYDAIFERAASFPGVTVLRHAVNRGKGAALKTAINFILAHRPDVDAVLTADADGQHDLDDILALSNRLRDSPGALIVGVRSFRGRVPFRSRAGNTITRMAMHRIVGHRLSDTQSGLRIVPRRLLPRLLKIPSNGYEFELEVLIAAKHLGIPVVEHPIRTIYLPGNPTSHFRPLIDSARIYWVLLRFTAIAVLSALLDNLLFFTVYHLNGGIAAAQVSARAASVLFNYFVVRRAAFHSDQPHAVVLPHYLALVMGNLILSYVGIRVATHFLPLGVFASKIAVETLLFAVNFVIQRDVIFTRRIKSAGRHSAMETLLHSGVAN